MIWSAMVDPGKLRTARQLGPSFNLLCNKDKYILSPAISLEVLTLEKRYYTR